MTFYSSNNLSENIIRSFTISRKNWLFSARPKSAIASAGVYTLIETAKANVLKPTKYTLKDIPGSAFMEYPGFLEKYIPWIHWFKNSVNNNMPPSKPMKVACFQYTMLFDLTNHITS